MSDRETRCYSGEVRAEQQGEQPTRIIGYGSVFNSRSEPLWGFREIIKPGAFDDVLGDDIRGLFNHDPNFILGRSASGTLIKGFATTSRHLTPRPSAIWCWHR